MRGYTWTVIPITWRNRRSGEAKLKIKEMGSRYLFHLHLHLARKIFQPRRLPPAGGDRDTAFAGSGSAISWVRPRFRIWPSKGRLMAAEPPRVTASLKTLYERRLLTLLMAVAAAAPLFWLVKMVIANYVGTPFVDTWSVYYRVAKSYDLISTPKELIIVK